jgi:hypothetical protein
MRYTINISILFALLSASSCETVERPEPEVDFWETHEPFELDYSVPTGLVRSNRFATQAEARGESDLIEASGIVISLNNPGYLWTHEDKSNTNEVFLLDRTTGERVASYELSGLFNRDWEDIEIGPGPEEGVNYIYLGDVGDNDRVYQNYRIHRFKEPVFEESHRDAKNTYNGTIETITFTYPNRARHDVETLLLDPWTKDIFLVTKRDFFSIIYVLPYPQSTTEPMVAVKVGEFPFTRAVGGNISLDGTEMLIKTYDFIMHWQRSEDENMVDLFMKVPELAPYNPSEPQGEAICFDENKGYFTLSEFSNSIVPVLYYYPRIQ